MITEMTRQMSFEDIKPKRKIRYEQILERLFMGRKTAKEVAVELFELGLIPSTERNFVSPRLTELVKKEKVRVVGERICKYTNRKVAVFQAT